MNGDECMGITNDRVDAQKIVDMHRNSLNGSRKPTAISQKTLVIVEVAGDYPFKKK